MDDLSVSCLQLVSVETPSGHKVSYGRFTEVMQRQTAHSCLHTANFLVFLPACQQFLPK